MQVATSKGRSVTSDREEYIAAALVQPEAHSLVGAMLWFPEIQVRAAGELRGRGMERSRDSLWQGTKSGRAESVFCLLKRQESVKMNYEERGKWASQ